MSFDISQLLREWEYQPGPPLVRKFQGDDGIEKIQLRLDVGLLQMNVEGRPDGQRPFERESLLEHFQGKLHQHRLAHDGHDEGFALAPEDCAELQLEAIQYHHRYLCLFQVGDYDKVIRDTERNLAVFQMVQRYAEADEMIWALLQFQPQLLMMRTRARATPLLLAADFDAAIAGIQAGIEELRAFYQDRGRTELMDNSEEIESLETWLEEVEAQRPMTKREQLEKALREAVQREDFEKAARIRDALRDLKPSPSEP